MKILALDLGKFKSVACCFDAESSATEYWTLSTDRSYLTKVLEHYQPQLVAIEACSIAAWVHDLCRERGYDILVCDPNQETWRWKNVKRRVPLAGLPSSGCSELPGHTVSAASGLLDQRLTAAELSTAKNLVANRQSVSVT